MNISCLLSEWDCIWDGIQWCENSSSNSVGYWVSSFHRVETRRALIMRLINYFQLKRPQTVPFSTLTSLLTFPSLVVHRLGPHLADRLLQRRAVARIGS